MGLGHDLSGTGPQSICSGGGLGGSGGPDDDTWWVYMRNNGTDDAPQYQYGVSVSAPLQKTIDHNSLVSPDSGTLDSEDISEADGWVNTRQGDYIYYCVEFDPTNDADPFNIVNKDVKSLQTDGDPKAEAIYLKDGSGADATYDLLKINIPIALVKNDPDGKPRIDTRYVKGLVRLVWSDTITAYDSDGANPVDVSGYYYISS